MRFGGLSQFHRIAEVLWDAVEPWSLESGLGGWGGKNWECLGWWLGGRIEEDAQWQSVMMQTAAQTLEKKDKPFVSVQGA